MIYYAKNSKSNQNDAKIMANLRNTISVLFSSQGQELEMEFEKRGMTVADIPNQLLRFFNITEDGVFAEHIATRMDIKSLMDLDSATAAGIKSKRKSFNCKEITPICKAFLRKEKAFYGLGGTGSWGTKQPYVWVPVVTCFHSMVK